MELISVKKIFGNNKRIMKTAELYSNGISKYELKKLENNNFLERISRGYYNI